MGNYVGTLNPKPLNHLSCPELCSPFLYVGGPFAAMIEPLVLAGSENMIDNSEDLPGALNWGIYGIYQWILGPL